MAEDDKQVEFGTLAEQKDEDGYDDRPEDDADDGGNKPENSILYGRDNEIKSLKTIYQSMVNGASEGQRQIVFLAGYSGMGKTSLVQEFVRQVSLPNGHMSEGKMNEGHPRPSFISGKFSQIKTGDPFSALLQALNGYALQLMAFEDEAQSADSERRDEPRRLQKRLAEHDIVRGNHNFQILCETVMPALEDLLPRSFEEKEVDQDTTSTLDTAHSANTHSTCRDINQIKFVFQSAIKAIATAERPMILFIDDLQWSDEASCQLLTELLKDSSLKNVMFIGSYRSNEINFEENDDTPLLGFARLKTELSEGSSSSLPPPHEMDIANLSSDSVAQFIADSLGKTTTDVGSITEAVYSKTLGNAFFVKQALEELKRKNVIYYDVMTFQWHLGDVSGVELHEHISNDVISIFQSKMRALPELLQSTLALVAYTNHTFDLELCYDLVKSNYGGEFNRNLLEQQIELAIDEGLLMRDVSTIGRGSNLYSATFKWAHDRVREAACELVPSGEKRDAFLLELAHSLMRRGEVHKIEWALFTAARHMNSIPRSLTDDIEVTSLNLSVGKLAASKGAFADALVFFNEALRRFDDGTIWREDYYLALELMNCAMESEQAVGNHESALAKASEITTHAKTLRDKKRAHLVSIDSNFEGNHMDYTIWIDKTAVILALYGIDIPTKPTVRQVQVEVMKFNMALRGRTTLCFNKFPVASDEDVITQISVGVATLRRAVVATRNYLVAILSYRLLRIALAKKIITEDLTAVVFGLTFIFRKLQKYKNVFSFGNVGETLMTRFPSMQNDTVFVLNKLGLVGVRSYQVHYRDTIEPCLEIHKFLLARGITDYAMACGMQGIFALLVSSVPLNEVVKSKLQHFQDIAANFGRDTFVVVFSLLRQFLYNLEGGESAAAVSTELNGHAFNEEEVQNNPAFEGPTRKMNNREISMARLHLAVYFDDRDVMETMLARLQDLPVFDICVSRQHFRVSFMGIASLILKKKNPKHADWAKKSISFFEKLAKAGSPNAVPVLACMKALDSPSVGAFDEAITVAAGTGLINMSALMSERCALWLMEKHQVAGTCGLWISTNDDGEDSQINSEIQEYIRNAFWFYHGWGAMSKCSALKSRYKFLDVRLHDKPPSSIATIRRISNWHSDPNPSTKDSLASDIRTKACTLPAPQESKP